MIDRLRALWFTEPARLVSLIVAVVAFAAAKLGLVVDQQGLGEAVTLALLVLLGGEATRARVSPAAGPVGRDSDAGLELDRLG